MTDQSLIRMRGGITGLTAVFHVPLSLGWADALDVLADDDPATMYAASLVRRQPAARAANR